MRCEGGLRTKNCIRQNRPDKPLVTIITAVFNDAAYLEKTIESISAQSYDNIEYLIIDGGSVDTFLDVVGRNEEQIDYWMSEPDNGIYDAWNKGVRLARGEWIVFLGAGDLLKPAAIASYVSAVSDSQNPVDFVCSRVNFVNSEGAFLRLRGAPFEWSEVKKSMCFVHVGAFHHKTLFERFGLFEPNYKSAGDYEFFMRCGSGLRTLFLDAVTVDVLVGGISLNNRIGIKETYDIQLRYGVHPLYAFFKYCLVSLKQKIRPYIRGY